MKILVIGGYGTIGKRVTDQLGIRHDVVTAGRKQGDVRVNIAESASINKMFDTLGELDAVVCIAGEAKWAPLDEMTEKDFQLGLQSKLMGQVNVVQIGMKYVRPQGSFTLTTGILAEDPVIGTASAAMVNGALHGFVKAASLEMQDGKRINAVAAGLVEDSYEKYRDFFPGRNPVPMNRVVNGYVRCIEGRDNGQIIRVYG